MSPREIDAAYRAAWARVFLALFAAVVMPIFVPRLDEHREVAVVYLSAALVLQYLIKKDIGGIWRVLVGGLFDVALLTFLVHRLGTVSTPLTGIYVLIGILNALVAPPIAARAVAAFGVAAYGAVTFAEAAGWLAYAPAALEPIGSRPDFADAARSTALLAVLVLISTGSVDRVARALRQREDDLERANARLEELSQRDPLTQLYNRRYFVRRVESELERVRRGHPMCLLMIDLDRFKRVNDRHGHLAGDDLLKRIATTLADSTRAVDVAGRYGGDEFVVLLTDTDLADAEVVAGRLVKTIREVGHAFSAQRPVTASIGLAQARAEDDIRALFNTADENAYKAKQAGGNRFIASPTSPMASDLESGPSSTARSA